MVNIIYVTSWRSVNYRLDYEIHLLIALVVEENDKKRISNKLR